MTSLAEEPRTVLFYESPHRLLKLLEQVKEVFGSDRKCCVSREISKMFEENFRGSVEEVLHHFEKEPPRGEIVVVVEGKS